MGGESKQTQTQQSESNPWAAAVPSVQGILGKLDPLVQNSGLSQTSLSAIDQLQQNAGQGNPFAGQINSFTSNLLNGGGANGQAGNVQGNYDTFKSQLTPYANGSMIGNNPALKAQLDQIMADVGNSVNGQFAAAGRDMSGANQQAYGRGVAAGVAPVLANQYNQDVANQFNAANALYGGGNTTAGIMSGMNQQDLANRQQGVTNSQDALDAKNYGATQTLNLEQLKQQLPAQTLGLLAQIGVPIAGLGGTKSGTATGTQEMSGAQQFATIAGGIQNLFPKAPIKFG